jgi:single-stranded-DNA-specific exonuclease
VGDLMPKIYRWILKESKNSQLSQEIQKTYGLSKIIADMLASRLNLHEVKSFLNPDLKDLHSPYLLRGIKEAKELIQQHIASKDLITIYGDYDVDGITATAILYLTLKKLGAKLDYYIPERLVEGYGINEEAIDKIAERGTKLIISVDCGITSVKEVEKAKILGIDVIITDHHSIPKEIPQADVVINPHLPGIEYPFCDLSGVGVAFKLSQALIGEKAYELLDIVSIGTIADIVPLLGENRIIVKEGLKRLNETQNIGLKALIKASGLENVEIDEYHVGFILAPRLNAAGRLKSAEAAVRLLISHSKEEVEEIAEYLNQENLNRQQIENQILQQAIKKVEETVDLNREKVIVLWDENWHPGVIGIVASRITERFHRPSILISLGEEEGKGSGRSIEGFNLYKALEYCKDYLIKYGGHEMAAGINIEKNNLEIFKAKINEYADTVLSELDLIPSLKIEAKVKNEKIDIEIAKQVQKLKPFGSNNPRPNFLFEGLTVTKIFDLNSGRHKKIIAQKGKFVYELMLFDTAEKRNDIKIGDIIDVVGSVEINTWNGIESVIINVKDVRVKLPLFSYYKNLSKIMIEYKLEKKEINRKVDYIIDKRGINNKWEYVLKLFKGESKTAVIVNTAVELKSLLRYLKKEKFVNFSFCNMNCKKENGILFFTNSLEPLKYYDDIIIYDIPFKKEIFYYILYHSQGKKIHLVFNESDIYYNLKSFDEIFPQRKDFIKLYKFIEKGNTILFKEHLHPHLNLNPIKFLFCIKAMQEIGLINVKERDNIFMLSKNSVPQKVNIEQTQIMQRIFSAKKEFIEFAKFLVSQKI